MKKKKRLWVLEVVTLNMYHFKLMFFCFGGLEFLFKTGLLFIWLSLFILSFFKVNFPNKKKGELWGCEKNIVV